MQNNKKEQTAVPFPHTHEKKGPISNFCEERSLIKLFAKPQVHTVAEKKRIQSSS